MRINLFVALFCLLIVPSAMCQSAPTLTSISPTTVSPGMQVTLTGSGFGATQGGSGIVEFQSGSGTVVSWSDTQIVATVPANVIPGRVYMQQNGAASNTVSYTVTSPTLTSMSPTTVSPGMQVTLTGSGFGATQGSLGIVEFQSGSGTVVSWSDTQIVATVPANVIPGRVYMQQNGAASNTVSYTVTSPTLTSISPTTVSPGMQVTLTGSGFGATQGSSGIVEFQSGSGTVVSWSDTQIVATVPANVIPGRVYMQQNGAASNTVSYTVTSPTLTSISPTTVSPGMQVTLTGSGFGATQGSLGIVEFQSGSGTVVSWSDTQIVATVPANVIPGRVYMQQNGAASNTVSYTVTSPTLTSISPTTVSPGMQVTLTGSGFGATQGSSGIVEFQSGSGTVVSWSDTQIVATVPANVIPGRVYMQQNGAASNTVSYTVTSPTLTSISPTTVSPGMQVTLTGSGFGATQGNGQLELQNSGNVPIVSWSETKIVATVPNGTIAGTANVLQNGVWSNGLSFAIGASGFTPTGNLNTGRNSHRAVLLSDGRVLVAGGDGVSSNVLASAEVYSSTTGAFTTTGSLATARKNNTITLLDDGTVLIVGGYDASLNVLASAEVYNPSTGNFTNTGSLATARANHTATRLSDGTVLIAGGIDGSGHALSSAELFIPSSGTFVPAGNLNVSRGFATATTLNNATVLLAGGSASGAALSSVELYDPTTKSFSQLPSLNSPRIRHTATLLNTGHVLIAGGQDSNGNDLASAELFDPISTTFTLTGNMHSARGNHTATLLTNGQALVTGGLACDPSNCSSTNVDMSASAEIYDPASGQFSAINNMATARQSHSATLLSNGMVLVAGGWSDSNSGLTSAELYQPATLSPANLVSIAIAPTNPTLVAGTSQSLTATGTFADNTTQTLASAIWSSSDSSILTVTNDSGGNSGNGNDSNNSGTMFGTGGGSATVSACSGSICGSTSVSVITLSSISVSPTSPTVALNSPQEVHLTATGVYSDGGTADLTSAVSWSSSDNSILYVLSTPSPSGTVVPGAVGTANAVATFGSISGSTPVSVVAAPAPPTPPSVANVNPSSGSAGTQVTVSGTGFGSSQASGYVEIGTTLGSVVSWSDTQIVANVSSGSSSGSVQVQQGNLTSNAIPFTVNTATLSGVTPVSGVAGTQVTITGSGFGNSQGNGLVWLGTIPAVVSSWSDSEIVAQVAPGSLSGNAEVLQSGVMSNQVSFTVPGNPQISNISPASGPIGTSVTINGSGFGFAQGSVWIGGADAPVAAWSDTQIQAIVASNAVTGVVKVQENTVWSNAKEFSVTGNNFGTNPPVTLVPDLVGMVVGDTRSIDALDSNGQPVSGLTWSSSDPTIATLSSDDPPIITAVAPGTVTITAGDASADVTIYSGPLPLGAVVWSDPGDGSGVYTIVPAVPSSTGVADVFAVQADGNVRALTSDGKVKWTANIGPNPTYTPLIPDFQGGFLTVPPNANPATIQHFDGLNGHQNTAYTYSSAAGSSRVLVHRDGTVFTQDNNAVVAIDPVHGSTKFTISLDSSTFVSCAETDPPMPAQVNGAIIAGDGYLYLPYAYTTGSASNCPGSDTSSGHTETHSRLLRVGTDGSSQKIVVGDWSFDFVTRRYLGSGPNCGDGVCSTTTTTGMVPNTTNLLGSLITNADQGVLYSWELCASNPKVHSSIACPVSDQNQLSNVTSSGGVSTAAVPLVPNQNGPVVPTLQTQNGNFIGVQYSNDYSTSAMESLDASGNIHWIVPNDSPQMATADASVIGSSGITYNSSGNMTGQLATLPTQSWSGNQYILGSADQVAVPPLIAASLWSWAQTNPSGTSTAARSWYFILIWQNDFTFTPNNPKNLPLLTTDISAQATVIKRAALKALQDAYSGVPVTVREGTSGGDAHAFVLNHQIVTSKLSYGVTDPNNIGNHQVDYINNMEDAQFAYNIVINNAQDESTVLQQRSDLIAAIGRAVGNTAAHEIAHQFLFSCCDMDVDSQSDSNARATFNSGASSPSIDPSFWTGYFPNPTILLHWENVGTPPTALDALGQCLGGGWRDFHGRSCHE